MQKLDLVMKEGGSLGVHAHDLLLISHRGPFEMTRPDNILVKKQDQICSCQISLTCEAVTPLPLIIAIRFNVLKSVAQNRGQCVLISEGT